ARHFAHPPIAPKKGVQLFRIFFFQAEDGIRDLYVTGVQTCALPISHSPRGGRRRRGRPRRRAGRAPRPSSAPERSPGPRGRATRSEERRVGKESRSRVSAANLLKN